MPQPVVVSCRLLRHRLAPDLRDLLLLVRLGEVNSTREASLLQAGDVHLKEAAGNESPCMGFSFLYRTSSYNFIRIFYVGVICLESSFIFNV